MKQGCGNLKMLNKSNLLIFLVILSCGRVYALPQDWPCKEIVLTKTMDSATSKPVFQGTKNEYQITIYSFDDAKEYPFIYNCGTAGCMGRMENLRTGKKEEMRFDCVLDVAYQNLTCSRISGDEYVLSKFSDNEYRVELCDDFYRYIYLDECLGCTCILRDSRGEDYSSDYKMNCGREGGEHVHCYLKESYNWAHQYENEDSDFENCVGLSL